MGNPVTQRAATVTSSLTRVQPRILSNPSVLRVIEHDSLLQRHRSDPTTMCAIIQRLIPCRRLVETATTVLRRTSMPSRSSTNSDMRRVLVAYGRCFAQGFKVSTVTSLLAAAIATAITFASVISPRRLFKLQ